ncbi:MAG: ATP-binding protein [Chromatiales bacterium]|nr:ATP-binding protein [Chromatiales bacterium]
MTDLTPFLDRLNHLLDRAERLLPPASNEPNWSAPAHRWRRPGRFVPVHRIAHIDLDDLLHVERQRNEVERNTRQFLAGLPANNVLLCGSRGTGKSSLVRALLTRYADDGLRLIEVEGHDLVDLPAIVEPLFGRPERFILYSDDLSFDAGDPGYKALKAMLDGSIAATPENVLIYATSNRRHLMPEQMRDNLESKLVDGEIHPSEAVEEKISLSERFGLWLSFYPFTQDQYLAVVEHWLARLDQPMTEAARLEAIRYATQRGSRSGRVAAQFARDWNGRVRMGIDVSAGG